MRIITGSYRGRRLKSPAGPDVRPTGDRVKESIFNILAGRVQGATVLDMFAGTGNLGIEAMSRGASGVHFIDRSPSSLRVLNANLEMLTAPDRAKIRVIAEDAMRAVLRLGRAGARYDIVFVDPPYRKGLAGQAVEALSVSGIVAPGGWIVAETDAKEPPPGPGAFELIRRSDYGDTAVYFLRRVGDDFRDESGPQGHTGVSEK